MGLGCADGSVEDLRAALGALGIANSELVEAPESVARVHDALSAASRAIS